MNPESLTARGFAWQDGSKSKTDAVIRNIRDQEKHHRKLTYEEEYVTFLDEHRFQHDPRYVSR